MFAFPVLLLCFFESQEFETDVLHIIHFEMPLDKTKARDLDSA